MIHKLEVNSRDVSLFKYLQAQKVATTVQIKRDVIKAGISVTRRRLQRLKNLGFLEVVARLEGRKATHVYSLSDKAMAFLNRLYPKRYVQRSFRSNAIMHDLGLNDLRFIFESKSSVVKFYSENEIHTLRELNQRRDLDPFRAIYVDGVIELKSLSGKTMLCAVELEVNLKARTRYRDKVRRYYLAQDIAAVLFISNNPNAECAVKYFEEKEVVQDFKKIYFADLEEILSQESKAIFENQDGVKVAIV